MIVFFLSKSLSHVFLSSISCISLNFLAISSDSPAMSTGHSVGSGFPSPVIRYASLCRLLASMLIPNFLK